MNELIWTPSLPELMGKISSVFAEWNRTPYMRDQLCRGVACDCVSFAYGFYCDLFGFPYQDLLPSLPKFSQKRIGNSEKTQQLISIFKTRFSMIEHKLNFIIPGDLIAARTGKGLGHVYIVGSERNIVYHCDLEIGVTKAGIDSIKSKPYILRSIKSGLWV